MIIHILCIYGFSASFRRYFSVTLIVISTGDEQFHRVQFFVFYVGWDCQISCYCVYKYLSWLYPPSVTGTVVDLSCHSFSIFHFQVFVFTYLLYFLTDMLLSAGTSISIGRHAFFFYSPKTLHLSLLLFIFYQFEWQSP